MNATTTARLLTAPARGGIAVIALQGLAASALLGKIFASATAARSAAAPGCARGRDAHGTCSTDAFGCAGSLSLGWIVQGDRRIDEAIVTTVSEQLFEINIHGGPQVARAVLSLLQEEGCKIEPPGQADPAVAFAHPDFDNAQIAREMLDVLPAARTALAVAAVTNQWSGGLSALLAGEPTKQELQAALDRWPRMRRLLSPAEVVIAGPVNAGKSALANALAGRSVSIVSPTAGTTRDWVRELVDLDGVPVWLTDTAGLLEEDGLGEIDSQAVQRAWQRVRQADVVLVLVSEPQPAHERLVKELLALPHALGVSGKVDILPPRFDLAISAPNLAGLPELRAAIHRRLGMESFCPTDAMPFTQRQVELLKRKLLVPSS